MKTAMQNTPKPLTEALKKIDDPRKIAAIFEEAVASRARLKVRHPKTDNTDLTFVESTDYSKQVGIKFVHHSDQDALISLLTPSDLIEEANVAAKKKPNDKGVTLLPTPLTFSLSMRNSNTFLFQSTIAIENGQITFTTPTSLFLVQRRKYYRFTIPTAYEMWASIPNPRMQRASLRVRLIDISMGGLALEMSGAYAGSLKENAVLQKCQLSIRGDTLQFDLVVRSVRKVNDPEKPANTRVVGCEFNGLSDDVRQSVESFLLEKIVQLQSGSIGLYEGDFV